MGLLEKMAHEEEPHVYVDSDFRMVMVGWMVDDLGNQNALDWLNARNIPLTQADLDWLQSIKTKYNGLGSTGKIAFAVRLDMYLGGLERESLTSTQFTALMGL